MALNTSGVLSGTPTQAGTSLLFYCNGSDAGARPAAVLFRWSLTPRRRRLFRHWWPAGYWSFDNGTATDNSGKGNNGTLVNAPALVAGKIGQD